MQITKQYVTELILEELTKSDVKDIVDAAIERQLKKQLPKAVKEELEKEEEPSAVNVSTSKPEPVTVKVQDIRDLVAGKTLEETEEDEIYDDKS